jgi:hypothetical protein
VLETVHFLIYYYPEERQASVDAARMAERAYARLSRVLDHQFREKKPIVLFSSRTDFGQNNVTGDLGEGTGGVTEALRHRMLLNFTGDYRSFEHVLAHEMVHAFQYDIFARGKAGSGLQNLAQNLPPLWFAEGMAEYLSLGPNTALTNTWMRDAALNGKLPTMKQLTEQPYRFFPYRFGPFPLSASIARSSVSWALRWRTSATSGASRSRATTYRRWPHSSVHANLRSRC